MRNGIGTLDAASKVPRHTSLTRGEHGGSRHHYIWACRLPSWPRPRHQPPGSSGQHHRQSLRPRRTHLPRVPQFPGFPGRRCPSPDARRLPLPCPLATTPRAHSESTLHPCSCSECISDPVSALQEFLQKMQREPIPSPSPSVSPGSIPPAVVLRVAFLGTFTARGSSRHLE